MNSSLLTLCLQSISQCLNIPPFILHFLFHGNYSSDVGNRLSLLFILRHRCTKLSSFAHPCFVHLCKARVNQYSQSSISFSGKLLNSLLPYVTEGLCTLQSGVYNFTSGFGGAQTQVVVRLSTRDA